MRADVNEHNMTTLTFGIANGGTTSDAFSIKHAVAGFIVIPAAITGTTVTWEVSLDDGGTWGRPQTLAGADVAHASIAANDILPIPPEVIGGTMARIVVSAQGAARTLTAVLKS